MAHVNISRECDNARVHWVVPSVRGRKVGFPLRQIEAEVGRQAAGGRLQIWLLGQNVNSWRQDFERSGHPSMPGDSGGRDEQPAAPGRLDPVPARSRDERERHRRAPRGEGGRAGAGGSPAPLRGE
ncbi:MAG: hypothetical protein HY815_31790 [Candidatus Riflebacteria bacterium]|nr:hypothetical protein [Candidatus Riflebacteria bacterium]